MLDQMNDCLLAPASERPLAEKSALTDLNPLELRTYYRLQAHRPGLAEPFRRQVGLGREGILRRLLQAVVRERLIGRDRPVDWLDEGQTLQVQLPSGRKLEASVTRRLALGRFDVDGPLWLTAPGGRVVVEHPAELMGLLQEEGLVPASDTRARERYLRFRDELENSAVNLALALAAAELRRQPLRCEAARLGAHNSLDYVEAKQTIDPNFSALPFYEQWVIEGHPLHPGARMKMGMEVEDLVRHAPEWGSQCGVALVAVTRTACCVVSRCSGGAAQLLASEYPNLCAQATDTLAGMGRSAKDYELIPVHRWQIEHTLPTLHAEPIERGEVILLPECVLPAYALISFRSFAPVQRRGAGKHHLKTAINVHMTSAVRTVSPNAAENGPKVSHVLADICRRESHFGGCFAPVCEDVGIYYRPTDSALAPETAAAQSKHLAAMFRENPENYVRQGEIGLPAAALTAESPLSSGPVVMELIEAYARRSGIDDTSLSAAAFVARYAAVSLPPFLTLMTRYGIALEGHMQNSVCVFRDGEPTRMLVRDLGAIRIVPARLERERLSLDLMPGSAVLADDVDDLRNKVYYSFIQNHLGELIVAIVRHVAVGETTLWEKVAVAARQTFAALKGVPGLKQDAADDEAALFQPVLALKALSTMRLRGDVTDYTFAEVENPLYSCYRRAEGLR